MPSLLTRNREMRRAGSGVYAWRRCPLGSCDAFRRPRRGNVCPAAGACIKVCYARNGAYRYPGVQAAHLRNLERVQDDLGRWTTDMLNELARPRYRPTGTPRLPNLARGHLTPPGCRTTLAKMRAPRRVRIHDAGDFLSEEYLLAWLAIASHTPDVLFYAYTKEVALVKRVTAVAPPGNFLWCFSLLGGEDHLVDRDHDRHATCSPTNGPWPPAGYFSQQPNEGAQRARAVGIDGIVANRTRRSPEPSGRSHIFRDAGRPRAPGGPAGTTSPRIVRR